MDSWGYENACIYVIEAEGACGGCNHSEGMGFFHLQMKRIS